MVENPNQDERHIVNLFARLTPERQKAILEELTSVQEPIPYTTEELGLIHQVRENLNNNRFRPKTTMLEEYALDLIETKGKNGVSRDEFKDLLRKHSGRAEKDLNQGVWTLVNRLRDKFNDAGGDMDSEDLGNIYRIQM